MKESKTNKGKSSKKKSELRKEINKKQKQKLSSLAKIMKHSHSIEQTEPYEREARNILISQGIDEDEATEIAQEPERLNEYIKKNK
jgi:hypothetical protein